MAGKNINMLLVDHCLLVMHSHAILHLCFYTEEATTIIHRATYGISEEEVCKTIERWWCFFPSYFVHESSGSLTEKVDDSEPWFGWWLLGVPGLCLGVRIVGSMGKFRVELFSQFPRTELQVLPLQCSLLQYDVLDYSSPISIAITTISFSKSRWVLESHVIVGHQGAEDCCNISAGSFPACTAVWLLALL